MFAAHCWHFALDVFKYHGIPHFQSIWTTVRSKYNSTEYFESCELIVFPIFVQIKSRYSLIRPIGHGAYGVVISALDKETGDKVAIKKISRAFEDPIDAKRILREIKLMKKFSHENVSVSILVV